MSTNAVNVAFTTLYFKIVFQYWERHIRVTSTIHPSLEQLFLNIFLCRGPPMATLADSFLQDLEDLEDDEVVDDLANKKTDAAAAGDSDDEIIDAIEAYAEQTFSACSP